MIEILFAWGWIPIFILMLLIRDWEIFGAYYIMFIIFILILLFSFYGEQIVNFSIKYFTSAVWIFLIILFTWDQFFRKDT